jgi:hypothetical protein
MSQILVRPVHSGANPRLLARYWPELGAGIAWLLAFALLADMPVWHDVVWQLWVARHLNAGVPLYSWIMETNPPLWFWMAQPIDALSQSTGIEATTLLVSAIFVLIGLGTILCAWLAAQWPALQRAGLLAGYLMATIFVCLADFAQREPLVLIGAIPYAMLIARRAAGHRVPWQMALAVALLATPMFALKHYFVLIPTLLEAWLIWHQRRNWRPARPETVLMVLGAVLYALAVVLLTPAYLSNMVPALQMAFGGLRTPLLNLLINQMNLMILAGAFYFWHFRRELSLPAQAALLLAASLTISFYLQFRGWGYHGSPVVGALLLALLLHLVQRPAVPMRLSERVFAVLLIVMAVLPPALHGPYRNYFADAADRLLQDAKPGMTVVMQTTKAARPWPFIEEKGLIWPSRYFQLWMMPTIVQARAAGTVTPELQAYMDEIRRQTVEDYRCNPPDIIIDDKDSIESTFGFDEPQFDMQAFFMEEPAYAQLMQSYKLTRELGPFAIYHRVAPLAAPTGPCTTISTRR